MSAIDLLAISEDATDPRLPLLGRSGPTVLADGARGSSVHHRGHPIVLVPATPAVVRDTVGAGDATMAGLIYALAQHRALDRRSIGALSD